MAGELILIVEDNERSRKLARDVLQFKGYQTVEAETGDEALQLARTLHPALIPGMDYRAGPVPRWVRAMPNEHQSGGWRLKGAGGLFVPPGRARAVSPPAAVWVTFQAFS